MIIFFWQWSYKGEVKFHSSLPVYRINLPLRAYMIIIIIRMYKKRILPPISLLTELHSLDFTLNHAFKK